MRRVCSFVELLRLSSYDQLNNQHLYYFGVSLSSSIFQAFSVLKLVVFSYIISACDHFRLRVPFHY